MASELSGTTTVVPTSELTLFHRNARKGDVDAIMASLVANGQYTPIVVNTGTQTGRPNEVLAGNHTLLAFRSLRAINPFEHGWDLIKVHWVDEDDEGASRINAADNQTWELGEGTDREMVFELLGEIGTKGTGYSDDEFDALEKAIAKAADAGDEDPEPPPTQEKAERAIGYTIVFDDVEQEGRWFEFVRWLKSEYPDDDLTIAERLLTHLDATAGQRA
jgi:hypothetical protein